MSEISPKAPEARPSIPEFKEVSEAAEIILGGQKYLLEKGDRVRIVSEAEGVKCPKCGSSETHNLGNEKDRTRCNECGHSWKDKEPVKESVQVTADDAYMAVDEFINVVHPAWLKAFRRLDEMGLVRIPTPDFRGPVDEAEYPQAAGLTKELVDQMEDVIATAKDLLENIRKMP